MRRRLLNLLTALSLLLCVAVVALWVRSYGRRDAKEFDRGRARWEAVSEDGRLRIDNDPQRQLEARGYMDALGRGLDEDRRLRAEWVGAFDEWKKNPPGFTPESRRLKAQMDQAAAARKRNVLPRPSPLTAPVSRSVPHAALASVLAVVPAAWAAGRASSWARRRRRRIANACPSCGYDLRATPDRCPECGTEPSARSFLIVRTPRHSLLPSPFCLHPFFRSPSP